MSDGREIRRLAYEPSGRIGPPGRLVDASAWRPDFRALTGNT